MDKINSRENDWIYIHIEILYTTLDKFFLNNISLN